VAARVKLFVFKAITDVIYVIRACGPR